MCVAAIVVIAAGAVIGQVAYWHRDLTWTLAGIGVALGGVLLYVLAERSFREEPDG